MNKNLINDKVFQMRTSDQFLQLVDDWRRKQPAIPSRAEAMRLLIENGLKQNEVAPTVSNCDTDEKPIEAPAPKNIETSEIPKWLKPRIEKYRAERAHIADDMEAVYALADQGLDALNDNPQNILLNNDLYARICQASGGRDVHRFVESMINIGLRAREVETEIKNSANI